MAEWGECDTGVMQIELEEEGGECDKCREKREEEERKAALETILEECREVNGHGKEAKCSIGIWKDNDTEKGNVECDPCRIKREEKERRTRFIYGKEARSSGSVA
ncbi:hypothetical protein FOIG_10385 [Fusarium odoratissimum NRRL 54006]|uniref:Uncharacterized protein n=2 Tax=Fusarium oxysporum species complex TaxID=171631 RepID=X0KKJ2_FUSO5|nr:uncharacterized protein FOIG_10385 [Fusarium odoratissimum NRRL 54006]EXL97344.1 hypothetical protein FOIG_10385 [Fusarium odoratissimum NRRL 54006]TXB96212.1 hypothetical protein FocTR4_00016029 [Fusarium oxysporum f. sp. cubense]